MDTEGSEASAPEILALLVGAFPQGAEFTLKQAWTALLRAKATRMWPELTEKRVSKVLWNAAQKQLGTPPSLWRGGEGLGAVHVFKDARWCLEAWEPQDVALWNLRRLSLRGLEQAEVVVEPEPPVEETAASAEGRAERREKHAIASQDPDRMGNYKDGQEVQGLPCQGGGRKGQNLPGSPLPPADVESALKSIEAEQAEIAAAASAVTKELSEGLLLETEPPTYVMTVENGKISEEEARTLQELIDVNLKDADGIAAAVKRMNAAVPGRRVVMTEVSKEVAVKIRSGELTAFSMGARVRSQDEVEDGGPLRGADGGGGVRGDLEGEDGVPGGSGVGDGADGALRALRPVPRGAPGEEEARRDALRWNVVFNERGERIPGIRFAPSFYRRSDGTFEWTGVSVVSFPEDRE